MTSKQIIIMKTTKFLISIGLVFMLFPLLVFSSCKKDEVEVVLEGVAPEFVLFSNGNSVNITKGSNMLSYKLQDERVGSQIDLVVNSGENRFALSILSFDAQSSQIGRIKEKKYLPNSRFGSHFNIADGSISDYGLGTWFFDSKMYVCPLDVQRTDFVEITSFDNYGKKVSGNFRFTVKDIGNPNDSLILSGYFINQNYEVLNKK